MLRLVRCALACAFLALSVPCRADSDVGTACGAPEDLTTSDETLEQFAAALAGGGPVNILAVGSATTVGSITTTGGQTRAEHGGAFPWQMLQALQTALPGVQFHLTVLGGRGMTAEEMLPLLRDALSKQHYSLVLWQTGTVEAVRGLRPDNMADILHQGAELVRDGGGDLVLIDIQFSRFLRANTDLDPYEDVMQQVATMPGVALFHRFELMRAWADVGRIDLERTPKADRDKALDQLNACLGQALARFVLSGADALKK